MSKSSKITNLFIALMIGAMFFFILPACEQKGDIKIGVILPLTGDAAKYGQTTKNGIDLALEEINTSGGVGGRKLVALYDDSQADPTKAVSILQKMVTVDKIYLFLGPLGSSEVLAVAPIANEDKVIILAPAASSPQITNAGDYIFRNVMSDIYDGRAAADFSFNKLGKKSAGIIYINNDFGIGMMESFTTFFEECGGKVVVKEAFNPGDNDFRTQLTKIKRASPEVVFLVGYNEMGYVLRQSAELGFKTQWVSFSMFEDPQILKIAGNAAEGVYYTYRTFDPTSEISVVKKFVENYKSKFNQEPDIFAALAYDATRILAQAIEKGGRDIEKIKQALYDTKDFPGVFGQTTFDQNGDVMQPIGIKKVENGKFVWVEKSFGG